MLLKCSRKKNSIEINMQNEKKEKDLVDVITFNADLHSI